MPNHQLALLKKYTPVLEKMKVNLKSENLEHSDKNAINSQKDENHSKAYKCDICGTSFLSKNSIRYHKKSAHMKWQKEVKELTAKEITILHKCDICEKSFSDQAKLQRHQEWHGECIHECDLCGKKFPSQAVARNHKRRIHFSKNIICRWKCGQNFKSHAGRMRHEKIKHYLTKPLEKICDICGKPCPHEISLSIHKKSHLNPSERIDDYKCSRCSEVFKTQRKVREHMKLVHQKAQYKCSKCDKTYIKEKNLKLHMEKHQLSKKYNNANYIHSCHQCTSDQKYSIVSLRKHLKTKHSIIFKCKEYGCLKTFWHEERYQRHMKKHQDSKCHLCYLVLANPINARIHLIGVHKLTIEQLISLGRYDPNAKNIAPSRKSKDGESWMKR